MKVCRLVILGLVFGLFGQSCAMLRDGILWDKIQADAKKIVLPEHRERILTCGDSAAQHVLLLEPQAGVVKSEWVFLVHGGGWRSGSAREFNWAATTLLQAGYRVAMANYRLVPESHGQALVDDVEAGLGQVTKILRAKGHNGPVIVVGVSAGAQLAAQLCWKVLGISRPEYPKIAGFVAMSGVLDFSACRNPTITGLIKRYVGATGGELDPSINMPSQQTIPLLLMFSELDGTVEPENSIQFAKKWCALNPESVIELRASQGLSHDELYWQALAGKGHENEVFMKFIDNYCQSQANKKIIMEAEKNGN